LCYLLVDEAGLGVGTVVSVLFYSFRLFKPRAGFGFTLPKDPVIESRNFFAISTPLAAWITCGFSQ
jgi:hypothetical protein